MRRVTKPKLLTFRYIVGIPLNWTRPLGRVADDSSSRFLFLVPTLVTTNETNANRPEQLLASYSTAHSSLSLTVLASGTQRNQVESYTFYSYHLGRPHVLQTAIYNCYIYFLKQLYISSNSYIQLKQSY